MGRMGDIARDPGTAGAVSSAVLAVLFRVAAVGLAVSSIAIAGPRFALEVAVILLAVAGLLERG
jgi:hypothetical protein